MKLNPRPIKSKKNLKSPIDESHFSIISGDWRRRKLAFPCTQGLRPTPNRARETLFNWLQDEVHERHCLDLFAGSGALGFEALSRGASSCLFLDNEPDVVRAINANLRLLKCQKGKAIQAFLPQHIHQLAAAKVFDLVFLDPPYGNTKWIEQIIQPLIEGKKLTQDAFIYIETAKKDPKLNLSHYLNLHREKCFGQVNGHLFKVNKSVIV
ncbi:MAG: 16S rRNA (guanine(966)-N(2))-methyltransferase RsmD [Cellvibrionales bacterium]|nr:16S rRNA (guanine(966)-N(2))-methyltransferase RsmD [Cellvibrionales bacterium]